LLGLFFCGRRAFFPLPEESSPFFFFSLSRLFSLFQEKKDSFFPPLFPSLFNASLPSPLSSLGRKVKSLFFFPPIIQNPPFHPFFFPVRGEGARPGPLFLFFLLDSFSLLPFYRRKDIIKRYAPLSSFPYTLPPFPSSLSSPFSPSFFSRKKEEKRPFPPSPFRHLVHFRPPPFSPFPPLRNETTSGRPFFSLRRAFHKLPPFPPFPPSPSKEGMRRNLLSPLCCEDTSSSPLSSLLREKSRFPFLRHFGKNMGGVPFREGR